MIIKHALKPTYDNDLHYHNHVSCLMTMTVHLIMMGDIT